MEQKEKRVKQDFDNQIISSEYARCAW